VNVRGELVCTGADGTEQRRDVMEIERAALAMETLGMNLNEGKATGKKRNHTFLMNLTTMKWVLYAHSP
jgi:hypothetical protein